MSSESGFDEAGVDERTVVVGDRGRFVTDREFVDVVIGGLGDAATSGDHGSGVEERTVVVERAGHPVEETVVVERGWSSDDAVERTVVVERGSDGRVGHAEERTVVVPRRELAPQRVDPADDVERTVVTARPDRAPGAGAPAGIGPAGASPAADADAASDTVTGRSSSGRGAPSGASALSRSRRVGGRRSLTPAPLDPATLRPAVPGRGAGSVEQYLPRPVPMQATFPPQVVDADIPTRDLATVLPSLARRSRRGAVTGIATVAGAGVVSVAGLIALALFAFGG